MKYDKNTSYPAGGDVNRAVVGEKGRPQETSSVKYVGSGPPTVKHNAAKPSSGESQSGPYGSK
jgi:hypothetical protein